MNWSGPISLLRFQIAGARGEEAMRCKDEAEEGWE